ncbi:MAG: UPF0182 family protein [SAR324 cluster bacterium]|nr:UPF0182 family protein [SAR324 cluster bacterium]
MSARKLIWIVVGVLVVIMYLGSNVLELIVDYIWFGTQGYDQVFQRVLTAKILIGILGGAVTALFLFGNLYIALRTLGDLTQYLPAEIVITPLGQLLTQRLVQRTALGLSLLVGLVTGLTVSAGWESVLLYLNGGAFNRVEPIFQRDVGFYIFTLPFLDKLQSFVWSVGLLSLMGSGLIYFLKIQSGRVGSGGRISLAGLALAGRMHMAGLGAFMLLVMAWGFYLERFTTMHELGAGELFAGPGYADIYGTLPILILKMVVAVLCALIVLYALHQQRYKFLLGAAVLLVGVFVGGNIYVTLLQKLSVKPNEFQKERPYLSYHIEATNKAFALDKVEERPLTEESQLTAKIIQENQATIQNIRLWDHEPLLDTFSQIQEIRTYYDFVSVDNDRYIIDGELRQTMLSPRELNPASLPSRTWVNERLTFTHGYGLTLGPVNRVDEQGLPVLFVKDLPPRTSSETLQINRPEIYYGELVDEPVFVMTDQMEFDYPKGDKNISSMYEGTGGVWIGSFLRRLLFAAYLRDVNILLASDFNDKTRALMFRNVAWRVRKLAPFFDYDQDPYLVIHEGRLVWIFDAYTLSDRYPYGELVPEMEKNYMRNPVKAVVDAYNGKVSFYLADPSDPIAQAYSAIFPGLIKPLSEMPEGLRAHIRHPFDYFSVQSFMYATYHMLDVNTFYKKEDQWEVPVVGQKRMEPYFTVMKLPGEKTEEFILMLPFTPRSKDNMAAWMVARSDGENYGKLVAYTFPKQKLVFGPKQIAARINQDGAVSQQITLWDQSGSNVIRGTLLVIPIETSLIYIQPIYLKAEEGRIPELKRVVVAYLNEIAMGESLEDALAQIFGTTGADRAPVQAARVKAASLPKGLTGLPVSPAAKAREHYDRLIRASRDGNWAGFGKELQALGTALRKLEQAAK